MTDTTKERIEEIRRRHSACARDPQFSDTGYDVDPKGIVAKAMIEQGHKDRGELLDLITRLTEERDGLKAERDTFSRLLKGKMPESLLENELRMVMAQGKSRVAALELVKEKNATLTAENKALTVQRDAMAEALKNARPLVEKWCHSQGNSQTLFATYLGPIDAALSNTGNGGGG